MEKITSTVMKRLTLILLSFLAIISANGQGTASQANNEKVNWYTIEEAEKMMKKNPRPVFIDTFTDWCGWCKKLDADVFSNPVIVKILNEKYYPVKFNAESADPVTFQGKTYINDGKLNKVHQLAYALLNGKTSYPTVVFLNDKGEVITPVPGYRSAKEFEPILVYFSGTEWQTTEYETFAKAFKGEIK